MRKLAMKAGTAALALGAIAPVLAQSYSSSSYSSTNSAADATFGLVTMLCICVFSLILLGLNIWLTLDALKRDYGVDNSMQIVALLLIWVGGAIWPINLIIYYFLVMQKYPKKGGKKSDSAVVEKEA